MAKESSGTVVSSLKRNGLWHRREAGGRKMSQTGIKDGRESALGWGRTRGGADAIKALHAPAFLMDDSTRQQCSVLGQSERVSSLDLDTSTHTSIFMPCD